MSIALASYTVEWNPTGSAWADISDHVLHVTDQAELTGNRDNALAFGDSSDVTCTVQVSDALAASAWSRTPIRVFYYMNGAGTGAFAGIITSRERDDMQLTFECTGYAELVRATKAYSRLFYMRPVATKTTSVSDEDPDSVSFRGGLINFLLWRAGGRPLEQNFNSTYASVAKFWYSCDQALIAPLWSWVAGEEAWDECKKLAQASGGMVYQSGDGTIIYRQPYGIADQTALATFDEDVYSGAPTETADAGRQIGDSFICAYMGRALRPQQAIAESSESMLLHIGETKTLIIEPQWPIYSLDLATSTTARATSFVATFPSNLSATAGTDFTTSVEWYAQRIIVTLTNTSGRPITIWSYKFEGQPVVATVGGSVTAGSGLDQRTINDNPYVQTAQHAGRLAQLYLKFYSAPRPVRSIKGCTFDPARYVGEVVALSVSAWGITAEPHIILSISTDDTGLISDYELVYVGDLGRTSDYFQVGPSYVGESKKITF